MIRISINNPLYHQKNHTLDLVLRIFLLFVDKACQITQSESGNQTVESLHFQKTGRRQGENGQIPCQNFGISFQNLVLREN